MKWTAIPSVATIEMALIEKVADAMGTEEMNLAMFEAVNSLVPVDEIWGVLVDERLQPKPFGWCGRRADAAQRAQTYAQDYHQHDPLLREIQAQRDAGLMLIRKDLPSSIDNDYYRWACFEEPGFRSKISVVRTSPGGWSMISFYRRDDRLSDQLIRVLVDFSVATYPLARRHFSLPDWNHSGDTQESADRIHAKLWNRFPSLTARECSVCAFTMVGHSSSRIAMELGIAQATVLTYRRRAYERLGITSAAELVAHLL